MTRNIFFTAENTIDQHFQDFRKKIGKDNSHDIALVSGLVDGSGDAHNQTLGGAPPPPLAMAGLLARLASNQSNKKNLVIVCRDQQEMLMQKQWLLFHRPHLTIFSFPPFDDNPDIIRERALTLFALQQNHVNFAVVTCYAALLAPIAPPSFFAQKILSIKTGEDYNMAALLKNLITMGYETTAEVRTFGDMVRHGGIIDIFPIMNLLSNQGQAMPIRIDFFGDKIEQINYFSPLDQRRLKNLEKIEQVNILPISEIPLDTASQKNFLKNMREEFSLSLPGEIFSNNLLTQNDLQYYYPLFFDSCCYFFDYLHDDFLFFFHGRAAAEISQQFAIKQKDYEERQAEFAIKKQEHKKNPNYFIYPPLPPEKFSLSVESWQQKIKDFFCIHEKINEAANFTSATSMPIVPLSAGRLTSAHAAAPLNNEAVGEHNAPNWQEFITTHVVQARRAVNNAALGAKNTADAPDETFQEKLLAMIKKSPHSILIAAHNIASLHRWQKLLADDTLPPVIVLEANRSTPENKKNIDEIIEDGVKKILLAVLPLQHGESWRGENNNIDIITDHDIFQVEFQWAPPLTGKNSKSTIEKLIKDITTLKKGDLITHLDYGIGQFLGLKPVTAGGQVHDCVSLSYRGGDKLYLPIENLDRLQRYGDLPDPAPPLDNILDKLGSADWQARVAKTRARIKELAAKLARNAALRQTIKAESLIPKDSDYLEFASLFPYPETRDQEQAINVVKNDLAQERPMDRLICGDVGFGKTEVALRASFCAVMAGKQVLVITPTTLLARQHYQHFVKRFKNFAVRIKQMSRFVTTSDIKKTKEELARGEVDIVIGTHGLLHRSIAPKNLGLVVVDEEHHFGVKQKERARELAKNVHLLSMSATPIPRSLQLSLHGIKDLSLIATPPPGRLPIKTMVAHLNPFDLKRVIANEMARGGQIFLVAPRVNQLATIHKTLHELIPDMNITMAHGQMPSEDIDQAMTDFADGKYHGLLSTNIIESGLDLPNVNTMIIFHGDQFGLAQLYQLRGRVGRGNRQGYCFITYPKDKVITKNAKKRLELLDDLSHLGAGFLLASHDLDMRGAGNLLGEEQSGHVREVGIELYQKMVMAEIAKLSAKDLEITRAPSPALPSTSEAVGGANDNAPSSLEAVKSGSRRSLASSVSDRANILPSSSVSDRANNLLRDWSPHIVLPLAVAIPEDYIPDDMVRLALYKELSESVDEKNLKNIEESLTDRFGVIPPETKNLLAVIALKQLCYAAGVTELKISPHSTSVMFHNNHVKNPEKLLTLLKEKKARMIKEPNGKITSEKIIFHFGNRNRDQMISTTKTLLVAFA